MDYGLAVGPGGRFVLLDKLGEGGMGEVWLANDRELSQAGEPAFVALKFLSSTIKDDPRALAALRTEVRRSQKLSHPNIVRIFDLHTTARGTPFVKMEFVEGNSLKRWLEERPNHVMPWRMAAKIAQQLASALQYAHDTQGIVHRDLKPGNLLLSEGPVIKLADFGIASAIQDRFAPGKEELALGTIWYASPQQLVGQPARPEDDVYAFGVTLYELLTGSLPLEAESVEEFMGKVRYEPPQAIPERLRALGRRNEVPSRLLALVECCLEKDPLLRPKTREISRQLPALLSANAPGAVAAAAIPVQKEWVMASAAVESSHWGFWFLVLLCVGLAVVAWLRDWRGVRTDVQKRFHMSSQPTAQTKTNEIRQPVGPLPGEKLSRPVIISEPSATAPGMLILQLAKNNAKGSIRYQIQGQTSVESGILSYSGQTSFALQPGAYTVELKDSGTPPWKLERSATVKSDQTNTLRLTFDFANLQVTSDPPGAQVSWPLEANAPPRTLTNKETPFTSRFKSGDISFTANYRYHAATNVVKYFDAPEGSASSLFHIVLKRTREPMPNESWTSSLGTVFLPVGPHMWASMTETTVGEFQEFISDTHYDASQGMFSVTSNGWMQIGFSWKEPGFHQATNQATNYPVIGVNWADAVEFCQWLTRHEVKMGRLSTNYNCRLPKTDEWFQLAGRDRFPWGTDAGKLAGNYSGKEVLDSDWPASWPILADYQDGFPRTAPVHAAEFGTNRLGFRHLGGNAAEWCEEKVLCGGSWFDGESGNLKDLQTTSIQVPNDSAERHDRNGFRVVIWESESIKK